jgi:hypothetical protein
MSAAFEAAAVRGDRSRLRTALASAKVVKAFDQPELREGRRQHPVSIPSLDAKFKVAL